MIPLSETRKNLKAVTCDNASNSDIVFVKYSRGAEVVWDDLTRFHEMRKRLGQYYAFINIMSFKVRRLENYLFSEIASEEIA